MTYCFYASVLPVWVLLQPRDFINSHQLMVALALLVTGLAGAALWSGAPALTQSAPAIAKEIPADAPPIFPFLFITIACGAVSGFHCLVSSGTSSKQLDSETDAQYVGYGAMLLEGALAVLVILACCAGVGMGAWQKQDGEYVAVTNVAGEQLVGQDAWRHYYQSKIVGETGGWNNHRLDKKVRAFIEGGANFITTVGLPLKLAIGIMAVLVASFAATTLDTATRLQRYVLQELSGAVGMPANKYVATGVAVSVGTVLACAGPKPGAGGMLLWPLFGATNQLLAGLAFMVTVFYLWRRKKPIAFAAFPMLLMLIMPAWAMTWNVLSWWPQGKYHLVAFGVGILLLQGWMVVEGLMVWKNARGVLEPDLPPLPMLPSVTSSSVPPN
jgi:carbon starvation protein